MSADDDGDLVYRKLHEVLVRLERLEARLEDLIQVVRTSGGGRGRAATPGGGVPPMPPRIRQRSDGTWEVWNGEGSGWGPYHGNPNPRRGRDQ